jgi:CheY-like chemotaxis protein
MRQGEMTKLHDRAPPVIETCKMEGTVSGVVSRRSQVDLPANAAATKRILIIDDEPGVRRLVSDLLSDEGYLVSEASDGARGLERLQSFQPHVVVLDLMMPVMSGWTFVAECRRMDGGSELPIIAMTAAYDARSTLVELDGLGVCACLAKPFDLDDLLSLVAQFA